MRHLSPEKHPTVVLIILTLFAVVGPVSIDIFTPSLPAITEYFGTTAAVAQWSVGLFMLGFCLSMLIVGPLADRLGRKNTLLLGYTIYLGATAATLLTDSIFIFIGARFIQAIFGCFGTAIARIIIRDYYQDQLEVKMLAYIGGCLTIAPMAAPIAGGYLQEFAGWEYSFYVMAAMAIIAIGALTLLPEKKPAPITRNEVSILASYKAVLSDERYLRFTIAAGTAFAGAFVFVAAGSFVIIGQLGLSPAPLRLPVCHCHCQLSAQCLPWPETDSQYEQKTEHPDGWHITDRRRLGLSHQQSVQWRRIYWRLCCGRGHL